MGKFKETGEIKVCSGKTRKMEVKPGQDVKEM